MNLVHTVPELHVASLNGINGLGYAEVFDNKSNGYECCGVIIFDEEVDLALVEEEWRKGDATFTGIVYHEDYEEEVTIPVKIKLFSNEEHLEPGATFVASRQEMTL